MIKMMIVDDEKVIREGLRDVLDWESIGVEVVACVGDGSDALDFFKDNEVDIILSDIVMPIMDGISLSKNIREIDEEVRIIIISAYQDLEYIRAAFKYEAVDYILKPFKNDALMDVVVRSIQKLKSIREKADTVKKIRKDLSDSLPAIKKQFWRDVINSRKTNIEKIEETASLIALPFSIGDELLTVVCDLDDDDINIDDSSILTPIEKILTKENVRGICEKINAGKYILILSSSGLSKHRMDMLADSIKLIFNKQNLSVSIGIGTSKPGILEVGQSYEEANIACGHRMILGRNKIIYYNNIKDTKITKLPLKIKTVSDDIKAWVETGETSKAINGIHQIFEQMRANGVYSQHYVSHICSEIYSIICQSSPESVIESVYDKKEFVQRISGIKYINDAEKFMIELLLGIDKRKKDNKNELNSRIIDDVRAIIRSRYMQKLQLSDIAKEVFLTPSYLATLFKKATGQTVNDYLTAIRIERAKALLRERDLSTADISEAVGYSDYRYFSRVFKKYVGKSPSAFRK